MKRASFIALIFTLFLTGKAGSCFSQAEESPVKSRILFIFDASQSMNARWQSDIRINIARKLLNEMLDSLESAENVEFALRIFGHQKKYPPQDCDDSRLEVPFSPGNIPQIRNSLKRIIPKGTTPISISLERAARDFPPCENCRNIIVLITDGIEECEGDPCEVSRRLQQKGIILKPFVIGIGRNFKDEFDCVGHYYDATREVEFKASLEVIISQVLGKTTSQVNLLDIHGNPTETNVPLTFIDRVSGKIQDNVMHTLNHRGLPDTLYSLDPFINYDMKVHTTPEVWIRDINIIPGKHNIIAADAPTGSLFISGIDKSPLNNQAIVRLKDDFSTLKIQYFGHTERYLVGIYDLELLTLPRIFIDDVEIKQNHLTTIEVPRPGIAVIRLPAPGYAVLFAEEKENDLEKIYTFPEHLTNQTLNLQPGKYRLVYRSRISNNTNFSVEREFSIDSGESVYVTIK